MATTPTPDEGQQHTQSAPASKALKANEDLPSFQGQPQGVAISWKRNLAVVWLAQCVSVVGFSFVFPFTPLFVQELGISDPAQAAFWAGLSGSAMGLTMFLFGPVWGVLADRFGRKKNVVRAMFGGAIVIALTGLSGNVYHLTALRFLTGIASGVFAPSMALVASTSPRERIAFGIGTLQSAMFVGSTIGPLIGGFLAESVGYRGAFFAAGSIIGLAGLLVLVLARENFQRPTDDLPTFRSQAFTGVFRLVASKELAPILGIMFAVQAAPTLMFVVLPILLASLGSGGGATATGVAFGILGITGAVAAYGTGWLGTKVRLDRIMVTACVGAAVFYLPLMFVDSLRWIYLFMALAGMSQGALISSASGLLGAAMPVDKQGTGFGAFQSVAAAAFGFGPLIGGTIATMTGLRSVFLVQSAGLFTTALVILLLRGKGREVEPVLTGGGEEDIHQI